MPLQVGQHNWPYPFWIAHRGAGKLAPENTLAALRLGAQHGYRMFECDAKLSADGVPFLMHDTTLTRTTNASEKLAAHASTIAGDHAWAALSQFDAIRRRQLALARLCGRTTVHAEQRRPLLPRQRPCAEH